MTEVLQHKIDNNEKKEHLDLKNDKLYKKLLQAVKNKEDSVKVIDAKRNEISIQELPEFYEKIQKQTQDGITSVLENLKKTAKAHYDKLITIFWSEEDFINDIFDTYLNSRISSWEVSEKAFSKNYWEDYIWGLVEFDYKSKSDFIEAFKSFYISKEDAKSVKEYFWDNKFTWQEAQKLNEILSSFEVWNYYEDSISGKLSERSKELLYSIELISIDVDFSDEETFSWLKSLNLIKNWKIDVNTAIQIVAFTQWKIDYVLDVNGKPLNKKELNTLLLYSLADDNKDLQKFEKVISTYNLENDLYFLIKTFWVDDVSEILNFNNPEGFRVNAEKYLIKVTEDKKEKFISIVKKILPDYSKEDFEKAKFDRIEDFLKLFMNSKINFAELDQIVDSYFKETIDNQVSAKLIKSFLRQFLTSDSLRELKSKLINSEIKDPIDFFISKFELFLKSNGESADTDEVKYILFNVFTTYAKKLAKQTNIETITSSDSFKKLEKKFELSGANPYQAGILAYHISQYAIDKNNGVIDDNLLRSEGLKQYLQEKLNLWIRVVASSTKEWANVWINSWLSSTKNILDLLPKITLSETLHIDKKTIEEVKQNNKFLETIEKYEKMWYEGYLRYVEQIENEKKLVEQQWGVITTVKDFNEQDFPEFKWGNKNISVFSTEEAWLYNVKVKIPSKEWNKSVVIETIALTPEAANKSILLKITDLYFGLPISFETWQADDFQGIIFSNISERILTDKDLVEMKKFYKTYALLLLKENKVNVKHFLNLNWIDLNNIDNNDEFIKFGKAFSAWIKDHLWLSWLKLAGSKNTFYKLDKFNPLVKKAIQSKDKWSALKEEILDNSIDNWIFAKAKSFIKKIWS